MNEDYLKARKAADRTVRRAVLEGRFPYIPALADIFPEGLPAGRNLGVMEIPLDQVIGTSTAQRRSMFAADFMPAAEADTEFAMKWSSFLKSQSEEGMRDPIIVYEYKHRFYVREGNKRVSVMKYLKARTIMADVTRIMTDDHDPLYEEFLRFFALTGMYDLDFTIPGSYRRLVRFLGEDSQKPWHEDSIRRLHTLFYRFRRIYESRQAGLEASASDAFLTYLSVHGSEELRTSADARVLRNIQKMKQEFVHDQHITITDQPGEKDSVLPDLRKVIPFLPEKPLRIAFVYDGDPSQSPAVFEHELGRIVLQHRLGSAIRTDVCDSLAAAADSDLIIAASPLLYEEAYRTAVRHPDKKFLCRSLYQSGNAIRTFDVRMYEAEFLLGALAAVFAENHSLAYIADYPIRGIIANINAFAVGAAIIDPEVKVWLGWTGTLDQDWQEQMQRLGIRIFAAGDLPGFRENAQEYGICRLDADGPVNLAVPVIHWANYYEAIINSILKGTYGSRRDASLGYWWGMNEGVLDINVSGSLPYTSRKLIHLLRQALRAGRLHPFEGELHSTQGMIQPAGAPPLSNEEIMTMNWLNDNIIGCIPSYGQLDDTGRQLSDVSGVTL